MTYKPRFYKFRFAIKMQLGVEICVKINKYITNTLKVQFCSALFLMSPSGNFPRQPPQEVCAFLVI